MEVYFRDLLEYVWNGFCCLAYAYIFVKNIEKRESFWLRFSISSIIYVAISALMSVLALMNIDDTYKFFTHSVIMLSVYVILGICYKTDLLNIVFITFLSVVLHRALGICVNLLTSFLKYYEIVVEVSLGLNYLFRIVVFVIICFVSIYKQEYDYKTR